MSDNLLAARALDAMVDAVVAADPDGRIRLWSLGAERLFGWTAASVVGGQFPGIPDENAQQEGDAALAKVLAGEDVSLATTRRRADGSLVDVWIVFSPMRAWLDGPIDGWLAVIRDATQERAVQRALRRRVELVGRLASVIASLNSDLDLPTVLQRISESGRELLAADGAAYVMLDGDDLVIAAVSGLESQLVGERIPLVESAVATVLSSGRTSMALNNDDYPNTSTLVAATSARLPRLAVGLTRLDGLPSGALYVFFVAQGRALGKAELSVLELLGEAAGAALANARAYDLTRRQREHERAVIEATVDGMAVVDADGLVRQWNPAAHELTGLSQAEVLGQPLPFPAPDPGVVAEHQLESGRWLEVLCAQIADTGETVVDFRDVSRSKSIEESKDLFLAVTSHELRTPITVVQGYASTLLTHWENITDEERRGSVERIAERTRALAALVEQLLLGSRAGLAASTPRHVVFDLGGMLRTAVAGFRNVAETHGFVLDIAPDLPSAIGDPSAIEIVFSQLLENAIKYSPNGGAITVSARGEGETIIAQVCDRGLGIPAGEHAQVFERFYQVGGERRRFGGVGLGLYIVQRLLEAHGGTVRALPRDGGGSCFEVTLPGSMAGSP
ncbi:MAG TPA: ATP-binding protein [Acidothermaceae bacterium]|nr:ATP-binding protein [Acidothermaceae bacterium]